MKNKNNFDEGLGTVYERFILNSFFDYLMNAFFISKVLEVPMYGMTGLTGINSVHFAHRGCKVAMVDSERNNVDSALAIWKILPFENESYEILFHENLSELPFNDESFELVWNFAALWHVKEPDKLLCEMARVTSNLILIVVPNKKQIGYFLRKYFLDKGFFNKVNETWTDIHRIVSVLSVLGFNIKEQGVMDVPPWPDTCMPIGKILEKLKIKKNSRQHRARRSWNWDIMSYYLGKDLTLKQRVERFNFIERLAVPWQLKALWAHHRYVILSKN